MRGFIDLHCHFIAQIDDGARDAAEGVAMLRALHEAGFDRVVATPHMRPGLFDNDKAELEAAYQRMKLALGPGLPDTALACEHYFDDVVFARLLAGQGLPYPGGRAVLLEFYEVELPTQLDRRFAELRRQGLLPVIAHPERYRPIWKRPELLEQFVDAGAAALLDTAALVGKYGQRPQRAAEQLLSSGLYHAACSDAHRPADVALVAQGMTRIEAEYGADELAFLFSEGPRALLEGRLP